MHRRALPPFADLREFIDHLRREGEVRTVPAPVAMALELTEMHRRVIARGGPVLRIDKPAVGNDKISPIPVVTNLFGTVGRVAAGLGTTPSGLADLGELFAWLRSPQPPHSLREARDMLPAARAALMARPKKVGPPRDIRDADPDLSLLPVQTCWPGDAGPLITWPLVVTRAPGDDDPAAYNIGVYRMQVIGRDRAIVRWLPMRGGASHHRAWQARGEDMPMAVVIGADPATMLAAVMPSPEGVSELGLAGLINDRRAPIAPCAAIPLHVPASAEIVLEGTVSAMETAVEGPFGDHTGYYNAPERYPVFTLKRLRIRDGAPYLTTFTGRAPDEPAVIGEALLEVFKPLLRRQIPEILDVWLPPEACSYRIAVVAIDKRYPGQARRVMMGFWSLLPQFSMTKIVIVVDGDVDTLERTPVDQLDFASPLGGLGGKLGIDATQKIGSETSREWGVGLSMDRAVAERVTQRWTELFPENTHG